MQAIKLVSYIINCSIHAGPLVELRIYVSMVVAIYSYVHVHAVTLVNACAARRGILYSKCCINNLLLLEVCLYTVYVTIFRL